MATTLQLLSADDIEPGIAWFRKFLSEQGATIAKDSPLDKSLSALTDFAAQTMSGHIRTMSRLERRALHREALPADFMIRAVHKNADKLRDQFNWKNFRKEDVLNTRDGKHSKPRDLVLELVAASSCASFATDVRRGEPPDPDVVAVFRGHRYGLECKNLYSHAASQHESKLSEGVGQIEDSPIDRGIVFANLANLVPNEVFFPDVGPSPFADPEEASAKAHAWADAFLDRLMLKKPFVDRIKAHAASDETRKLRAMVVFVPTLAEVAGTPAPLYWTQVNMSAAADDNDRAFVHAFHLGLQDIGVHRMNH